LEGCLQGRPSFFSLRLEFSGLATNPGARRLAELNPTSMKADKYTLPVGIALVMANMIGTGVFTSLGYQVGPLPSAFTILLLWLLGGVVAICGAMTYAEISVTLQRSGGEYYYLSKTFHPLLGFLAGWTSALVGFAGAISAVALAIGEYASHWLGIPVKGIAVGAIFLVSGIHWFGVRIGGTAQTVLTSIKVGLIAFFCLAPLFLAGDLSGIDFLPRATDWQLVASSGFVTSLVYVVFAYTGWNAAAYVAGNMENPVRNVPRALLVGTMLVTIIYLALNAMFLYVATFDELQGKNDIGNVVAFKLFGPTIGTLFTSLFSMALLSTLSAMTIAGPRVTEAMGHDYPRLRFFSRPNRFNMPYVAILFQLAWSVMLVVVSSFQEIIQYISVSLSFFSMLTVVAIFRIRKKTPPAEQTFRIPLYPFPPILFIIVSVWMMAFVFVTSPVILAYVAATLLPGVLLYAWASRDKVIF
jgi:APA family basic amino acid/polyamine antiporter